MKKLLLLPFFILFSVLFCACASAPDVKGSWIDVKHPIPPLNKQGIFLGEGGKAASINGTTTAYRAWKQDGKTLTLIGVKSEGAEIKEFEETYKIKSVKNGIMVLKKDNVYQTYVKDNSANYKENK